MYFLGEMGSKCERGRGAVYIILIYSSLQEDETRPQEEEEGREDFETQRRLEQGAHAERDNLVGWWCVGHFAA